MVKTPKAIKSDDNEKNNPNSFYLLPLLSVETTTAAINVQTIPVKALMHFITDFHCLQANETRFCAPHAV